LPWLGKTFLTEEFSSSSSLSTTDPFAVSVCLTTPRREISGHYLDALLLSFEKFEFSHSILLPIDDRPVPVCDAQALTSGHCSDAHLLFSVIGRLLFVSNCREKGQ